MKLFTTKHSKVQAKMINSPPDICCHVWDGHIQRSLDHGRKAWCIDRGHKILGHHWLADTGSLLSSLSLQGQTLFLGAGGINRRPVCTSLSGIVPPRGARVGQAKALRKVGPMMGINGWEMSTNMAVYHSEGHFLDAFCFMWTGAWTQFLAW